MKILSLTILLIAFAALSTAENCGGIGRHISLRVGDCNDETSDECRLPTEVELRLAEKFVLSAASDQVRVTAQVITPLGSYEVVSERFDNLDGGQEYEISQTVILGPQLAGQSGTFLVQIFDVATDVMEICGVLPQLSVAEA